MMARSEAELQTHVTRSLRSRGFLAAMGLLRYGAAAVEAKHVVCPGCDGRGEFAARCNAEDFETTYRANEVTREDGTTDGAGPPPWRPCAKPLPFSAIETHQRQSVARASGDGLPLVHKISDSAAGFKPCDTVAIWGGWGGYAIGWACGGVTRYYLVPRRRMEALMAGKARGSVGEADAWRESGGRCVVVRS